ncbi:transcriptional regulator of eicosapentaenoic acid synthesis PfaR [Colwellia asteriadis]|uniref:Transcriptional regulator of eicosapentaenoic acid synthesis PfaR n=1 Tax=Colwellia asteriadis TaxID=517723 RepID=A0ABP3WHP7_9GAMM
MAKLHANATTTPEMRAFIHESDLPTAVLARLLKISEATVRKWRKRESFTDGSHVPKQLNTTLTEAQEYVVIELRTRLLLSLDELLAVCKQFINANVSRAGLQRCLKRHGVSKLTDMQACGTMVDADNNNKSPIQVRLEDKQENQELFAEISPQAMHQVLNRSRELSVEQVVQVKVTPLPDFSNKTSDITEKLSEQSTEQLTAHSSDKLATNRTQQTNQNNQTKPSRLLIANDPASGWVYVDIYDSNESEAASRYMSYVLTKAPFHIRRILAGNYSEFLSRFRLLNDSADKQDASTEHHKQNENARKS